MTLRLLGGLDPTGGAGIARDLATAFTLDRELVFHRASATSHAAAGREVLRAAITATTVQGIGVTPRTVDVHAAGVKGCLLDTGSGWHGAAEGGAGPASLDVTKLGLVPDALASTVAAALRTLRQREAEGHAAPMRVVVDPVLGATAGGDLGVSPEVSCTWLGLADLVTPNLQEAERLLDVLEGRRGVNHRAPTSSEHDPSSGDALPELAVRLARALAASSARDGVWVLLKGGHAPTGGLVRDVLASSSGEVTVFDRVRWRGPEIRGTGCALATAIATSWHAGRSLVDATQLAIDWLDEARRGAVSPEGEPPLAPREPGGADEAAAHEGHRATSSLLRVDADVHTRWVSALAACVHEAARVCP